MSNNGKLRPSQAVAHVRPFSEYAEQAKELGFDLLYYHEGSLYEIHLRLEPRSARAREAVRVGGDDATVDGIETKTIYDKRRRKTLDDTGLMQPYTKEGEFGRLIEIASQDAALYIIGMAKTALDQLDARRRQ